MVWSQIFTRKELTSYDEPRTSQSMGNSLNHNDTRPVERSLSVQMLNTSSSSSSCSQVSSPDIQYLKSVVSPQDSTINNLKRSLSTSFESSDLSSVAIEEEKSRKKFKIDSFETLLNCKVCNKVFDCPVTLPCGDTLCRHHIIHNAAAKATEENFDCSLCYQRFQGSCADISANKIIQEQIDMDLNKLNFGSAFAQAKHLVENLDKEIDRLESFKECYFKKLKQNYDELRLKTVEDREAKKRSIDKKYDNILNNIDVKETDSYEALKQSFESVRSINSKMDVYRDTLNSFEPDEKKWKEITLATRFYNFKLVSLENQLKTSCLSSKDDNKRIVSSATKSDFGLNECQLSKKISATFKSSDEGFYVFNFENFKNFSNKVDNVESTEQFQVNNTKWYIEFGNNGIGKEDGSNSYDVYLCYICSDLTKIVEVDFLFELIDAKNPINNKMLKIPLLPFSYNNDSWSFSVKKEIADRFYDVESDSIKFAFYIKPTLISVERECRYNFE